MRAFLIIFRLCVCNREMCHGHGGQAPSSTLAPLLVHTVEYIYFVSILCGVFLFSFFLFLCFVQQICHGAAELLHTHFCCTQWHACGAFDDRLEDDAFLHYADLAAGRSGAGSSTSAGLVVRNGTSSSDGGASGARSDGGGSSSYRPMPSPLPAVAEEQERGVGREGRGGGAKPDDPRIKVLHEKLVRHRAVLWEEIETKMVGWGGLGWVCMSFVGVCCRLSLTLVLLTADIMRRFTPLACCVLVFAVGLTVRVVYHRDNNEAFYPPGIGDAPS